MIHSGDMNLLEGVTAIAFTVVGSAVALFITYNEGYQDGFAAACEYT